MAVAVVLVGRDDVGLGRGAHLGLGGKAVEDVVGVQIYCIRLIGYRLLGSE